MWLRRRWPVGFAVVVALFSVYSMSASGVALIALFTVAVGTARAAAIPGGGSGLVLTTFDTGEYVLRALRVGASGFLLKHTLPADILRAISRVSAGEPILEPAQRTGTGTWPWLWAGAGPTPRSAASCS